MSSPIMAYWIQGTFDGDSFIEFLLFADLVPGRKRLVPATYAFTLQPYVLLTEGCRKKKKLGGKNKDNEWRLK